MMTENNLLLQTFSLNKHFGGLDVIRNLSMDIEKGKITALIGPNGAGKTTLFNILTGFFKPSSGDVVFDGRSIIDMEPHKIANLGIVRSFQEVRLIMELTLLENVMIALRDAKSETFLSATIFRKRQKIREVFLRDQAIKMLEEVGLKEKVLERASNLSYGQAKLLEITRVRAKKPKLLLLDEPAAGLSSHMLDKVSKQLLTMRDNGITIFFIEHNIPFVIGIADKAIVLNKGEKIFEGKPSGLMNDLRVREAYLGKIGLKD